MKILIILFCLALVTNLYGREVEVIETSISLQVNKNEQPVEGFSKVTVQLVSANSGMPITNQDLWFTNNSYQIHVVSDYNGKTLCYIPAGNKELFTQKNGTKEKFSITQREFSEDSTYLITCHINMSDLNIIEIEPMIEVEKPVIYIYSENDSTVLDVSIFTKSKLEFVYPKAQVQAGENELNYNLIVNKDGTIISEGKEYPYLFWDGKMPIFETFDEGYILDRDSVINFLDKSLLDIGFNDRERTDFITYWAPRMQKQDRVCLKFRFEDDYSSFISKNRYSIQPDTELRLFMSFTYSIPTAESFKPYQDLPSIKRHGLTVIEWGGSEISLIQRPVSLRMN